MNHIIWLNIKFILKEFFNVWALFLALFQYNKGRGKSNDRYMKKMWRPLKYDNKKYEQLTRKYLAECKDTYKIFCHARTKTQLKAYRQFAHMHPTWIPTVGWLARFCWLNRSTVYDWCKKYPDFSDMVEELKLLQTVQLINGGLTWVYNSKITILMLYSTGYFNVK